MFTSMSAFLWFFFIVLGLIVLGILFEEKLIAFEEIVWRFLKAVGKTVFDAIRPKRKPLPNRKSNHA